MRNPTLTGNAPHPGLSQLASDARRGAMGRREFLTRATTLGLTAVAAGQLIGLRPAPAQDSATPGGTLRVQMSVRDLPDPRLYAWAEHGNQTRGTLEYLVEYNSDGSFRPMLLESWEINEGATEYTLNIRPGIRWSNGDPFTAEDVARNIEGWCRTDLEGSSTPARFGALIDATTGRAYGNAIRVVDETTVLLTLATPDISLIANFSDYPLAITHKDFTPGDATSYIGTGPYRIETLEPGHRCTLVRREDHDWWGTSVYGGPYLDRIEYIDLGTDPATALAAIREGEVDMLHESVGAFVDALDTLDLQRSEVLTASTLVIRPNQQAEIDGAKLFSDIRLRRAIQLAVNNEICLELGHNNRGTVAENHHVSPLHPSYASLPAQPHDPRAARALLEETGLAEYEFELHSIDDDWLRNTTDAVAAQMRDAGFKVRRALHPGSVYWERWNEYPFSSTNWNHRPLAVQVHALAYKSGAAWNEFGFANDEFDDLIRRSVAMVDADARRALTGRMEEILQEEAVTIQPYWRKLYRHMARDVTGAEMHVSLEHHHYKWARSA